MKTDLTGKPGLYLKFEISAGYLGGEWISKEPEWPWMTTTHFSLILFRLFFQLTRFLSACSWPAQNPGPHTQETCTRRGCSPCRTHRTWSSPEWGSGWRKSWEKNMLLPLWKMHLILILGCKTMPAIRIIKMPLMIGRLQHLQTRNQFSWQIIPLPQIQTLYYSMTQVQFSNLSEAQPRRVQPRNQMYRGRVSVVEW